MPWDAKAPNLGFTTGEPWLPLGAHHQALAVSEQEKKPDSALSFARHFLSWRKSSAALRLGEVRFHDATGPVLAFTRSHGGEQIFCAFNMSAADAELRLAEMTNSRALNIGCGSTVAKGDALTLGPFAAHFARL
jgi:alpha-glucosidase